MNYQLPADLAQKLLDYLAMRPYAEVKDLVPALLAIAPIKEEKTEGAGG